MTARERLKIFLQEYELIAKKSLGQNFLINDHTIEKIIDAAKKFNPEELVEIGPGPGALTFFLKDFGAPLKLIELDHFLAAHWREKGFKVFEEDALQLNWKAFFESELQGTAKKILVSNLPYQISSSIVIDRSLDLNGFAGMVLMFQKEVAQRIRALPSTENYGMLSVIAQNFWTITTVCDAGSGDFSPAPKVSSRVLSFTQKESTIQDRRFFLRLVKQSFYQRRKLLKSNLSSLVHDLKLPEDFFIQWLSEQKLKETCRAEELSPLQYAGLYEYFNHSRK